MGLLKNKKEKNMTTNSSLKINTITSSTPSDGDIMFDPTSNILSIYNNGQYNTIGSASTSTYANISSVGYGTYATTSASYYDYNDEHSYAFVSTFFSSLTEEEIRELLVKYRERETESNFKRIVRKAVMTYHFSESFLLEYADLLDKDTVCIMHSREIKSGEYSTLKALYMLQE